MGGIVAAETLLLLANERPISAPASKPNSDGADPSSKSTQRSSPSTTSPKSESINIESPNFMFPHIQGLLALDTPFLGLAPEMIAHGLEGGHKFASSAYNTYTEVASLFGRAAKNEAAGTAATPPKVPIGALPAPTAAEVADAAASPKWQSWGKYAMFAGAAGAVAAGGVAALYSQREKISAGWSWAGSHLLFVGDLAKAERLRQRVETVNKQCTERGIGAANLYTNLGKGAREGYGITETLSGRDRTFCNLPATVKHGVPQTHQGMKWMKAINEKAQDETTAHMTMFLPRENPGFYALSEAAKELISSWVDQGWYQTSTGPVNEDKMNETIDPNSIGKDWEGLDSTHENDDDEGLHMRDEDDDEMKDADTAMLEGSVIIDKSPNHSTTLKQATEEKVPIPMGEL